MMATVTIIGTIKNPTENVKAMYFARHEKAIHKQAQSDIICELFTGSLWQRKIAVAS